jgi:hypothetical protein
METTSILSIFSFRKKPAVDRTFFYNLMLGKSKIHLSIRVDLERGNEGDNFWNNPDTFNKYDNFDL